MRLKEAIISALILANTLFAGGSLFVPDRLLVRFEDYLRSDDIEMLLFDTGIEVEKQLVAPLNLWRLTVDLERIQLASARNWMDAQPEVLAVQYDHYLQERVLPDDPGLANQWNFENSGQSGGVVGADIHADEAWEITTGGTTALGNEIVVAVVDNGFDIDHPDLIDNVWINSGDFPDNGIDEDYNGYLDDHYGWDAYDSDGSIPQASHGTHVAGIIGARSNNANQVAGMNWQVKLMCIAGASTLTSTAMEGYGYAYSQKLEWLESNGTEGAFVVATNSSFGVDYADCEAGDYPLWNQMYDSLGAIGILSAAATANANLNVDTYGDVPTTCTSPYLIAVTSTTRNDVKAGAGYGAVSIDLGAPGSSIYSTNSYGGTTYKSGTSMASPHVAGAIAFLHAAASPEFAQYYLERPDIASLVLKSILLNATDSLETLDGVTVSGGRLNLYEAALAIQNWEGPAEGDLNGDLLTNVQDLVVLINIILGRIEATPEQEATGDLNFDMNLNVQDLILLTQIILD